jgi:beta-glucanase (GH16 family)
VARLGVLDHHWRRRHQWGTFTPDSLPVGATWVFNKPFYVILNLAVGGGWAGLPDRTTEFPATMLVDWVKWEPA